METAHQPGFGARAREALLTETRIQVVLVYTVHTEDEIERAAEELDESPPSDTHVPYPRHTSLP
jgi:hypothetical protein